MSENYEVQEVEMNNYAQDTTGVEYYELEPESGNRSGKGLGAAIAIGGLALVGLGVAGIKKLKGKKSEDKPEKQKKQKKAKVKYKWTRVPVEEPVAEVEATDEDFDDEVETQDEEKK